MVEILTKVKNLNYSLDIVHNNVVIRDFLLHVCPNLYGSNYYLLVCEWFRGVGMNFFFTIIGCVIKFSSFYNDFTCLKHCDVQNKLIYVSESLMFIIPKSIPDLLRPIF